MSQYAAVQSSQPIAIPSVSIRPLLRNVYIWMTVGLAITTIVAYLCANVEFLLDLWKSPWIALSAFVLELVLVLALATRITTMDPGRATAIFLGFAALTGFSLTGIALAYEVGTLAVAFASAASLFIVMSLVGLFTNMDLTKTGTYLVVGLIALIIAMLINIFVGSNTFEIIISAAGVLIFAGLTASDTQKISRLASDPIA